MPPKKAEKVPQLKGAEAEDLIENYLVEQYRPFAVNDIVQNLHNKVSKTNATKALDALVAQDRIICKLFGKAAIYVCKEQPLVIPDGVEEKDITIEAVNQLREECGALNNDVNEWQGQLNQCIKDPSNKELLELIAHRKQEIQETKEKLDKLEKESKPENTEMGMILMKHDKVIDKAIKQRRRIMFEAVSLVSMAQGLSNQKAKDEYLVCVVGHFHLFCLQRVY
ncbi:Hop2p Ecym_1418 [Eremothecium cymbalariae DBVPG|uniref:Homologous-pairing protein 2 winged helix domain-containing protein n=1 Tax=Eremothecium cymbalariae (strain CBS 270.75 / DBVPG 7215 / KCTC 17166 / NRRL Y-17582) TaxID=931890 RepID=G8JM75_ERECY|nr:hypothetical protein Ecym_1418 [Eremothecium cymbalariae DBVPG\